MPDETDPSIGTKLNGLEKVVKLNCQSLPKRLDGIVSAALVSWADKYPTIELYFQARLEKYKILARSLKSMDEYNQMLLTLYWRSVNMLQFL